MATSGFVLVTGASRGVGRAIGDSLACRGYEVINWSRSSGQDDGDAGGESTASRAHFVPVDLTEPTQIENAAGMSLHDGKVLAGVVLNAGAGRWAPLESLTQAEWEYSLRLNLSGAFYVLQHTLPLLR